MRARSGAHYNATSRTAGRIISSRFARTALYTYMFSTSTIVLLLLNLSYSTRGSSIKINNVGDAQYNNNERDERKALHIIFVFPAVDVLAAKYFDSNIIQSTYTTNYYRLSCDYIRTPLFQCIVFNLNIIIMSRAIRKIRLRLRK